MAVLNNPDTDIEMAKNRFKEELPLSASPVQKSPTGPVSRQKQLVDTLCICLNIASTVLLVFLNKW
jgi:hypothetical protein